MSSKSALKIALIYALVGVLWILFSDKALEWLVEDSQQLTRIQTYKGWAFVLVSAMLFYVLSLCALRQVDRLHQSDPLTKLLRHYRFQLYLQDLLSEMNAISGHVLVIEIDIDDFKHLNAHFGYEKADQFLQLFARKLQEHYTADTLIARPGTDRFLVAKRQVRVQPEVLEEEIEEVRQLAAETAREFKAPNTICMGMALSPRDGDSAGLLLAAATTALNNARLAGPGTARIHNAELSERERERQELLGRLQETLDEEGLSLVYQPQFAVDTGRISGCEVLVRWNDPVLGFVSPDLFIPLAERYRLIDRITRFVIHRAYQELSQEGLLGSALQRVSVNVSAVEFSDPQQMEALLQEVRSIDHFRDFLQLEITETAALNNLKGSAELIRRLREEGLRFSIDDFGTGYSSLAVFKDLPVDEIKVDRGFIHELAEQSRAAAIVEAIIHMARSFNVAVVAEGVETEEQLAKLRACGCHEAQGFLLAKPMKLKQLKAFIAAQGA